jgi:serine/threonine protein kinase/tetratricopeptide (TPR) repeat protein
MLAPGTRLGTYEIIGSLGAGGMGEVYRAKDLRLGREIALKMLPAALSTNEERLARFEREARTVAGLNHPNIVVLHSVEDEDGVRFLTMELVEGRSLDKLVTPGGLPLARVLELGIALSDALTAAHEKGVVHRDLKPANVMVSRDNRLKVLDFGLAKLEAAEPGMDMTQASTMISPLSAEGLVVGTIPYMAPEQIRGETVDARTDLFSFGVMLYELASGRRPFTGPSAPDVTSAILRDSAPSLESVRADLPADFYRVVSRCLEKEPRARFQTALDVCNELRRVKHSLESGKPDAPRSQGVASVGVLPFVNRSRDEEDEYFSDGLADELISLLTKIRGLRVAARASSFQFKGKNEDLQVVGHKLNVATILDGSVRKSANRVRISVQLVRVADGEHMWSETYDRTLEDIFTVQDDIAQAVVKELRRTLLGEEADSRASGEVKAEVAQAAKGRGQDPEAMRLVLQARHSIDIMTQADLARGIALLKEALQLDPNSAIAWAELADAYIVEGDHGWIDMGEGYAKINPVNWRWRVREAVNRALSLERDLAEAHVAMARVQSAYDWDWAGAEASLQRALELAPSSGRVLLAAATLQRTLGHIDAALDLYRRAVEADPLNARAHLYMGHTLLMASRHIEALASARKCLELAPNRVSVHGLIAHIYLAMGRLDEALIEAAKEPDLLMRDVALACAQHSAGDAAASETILADVIGAFAEIGAYQVAQIHAWRGEADLAFEWLERAHEQRDNGLDDLKLDTLLRPLHNDARWAAFLSKMRLAD